MSDEITYGPNADENGELWFFYSWGDVDGFQGFGSAAIRGGGVPRAGRSPRPAAAVAAKAVSRGVHSTLSGESRSRTGIISGAVWTGGRGSDAPYPPDGRRRPAHGRPPHR